MTKININYRNSSSESNFDPVNLNILQSDIISEIKIDPNLIQEFVYNFVPTFYGIENFNGYDYLELQNLSASFSNPSMADIKIGKVTYDPNASETKIQRATAWKALPEVGFCFLGIKRNQEAKIDKKFCRSLKVDEVYKCFELFLPMDCSRIEVVDNFILQLDKLISWFERQDGVQFYSSSLLMVYCSKTNQTIMKMIDFAHVFYEPNKIDENYLFGARNLKKYLQDSKSRINILEK